MDQGRPLDQSPTGPWTSHIESKATPLPIIQYHDKMAFRTTTNRLSPEANASAEVQQSTTILPLQYDSLVALVDLARHAPQDPLSMCIPLFVHAAFSEVQFLNLMESRIQVQTDAIAVGVSTDAVATFEYLYGILNRHATQMKDSTRAIFRLAERSSQGFSGIKAESGWPPDHSLGSRCQTSEAKATKSAGRSASDGAFTARGLLEDYEHLHTRCIWLAERCTRGITLSMNIAAIEESRKAIEQSERLKRLTLLATFFIPLSFCSSLFGMNIDLLGQNTVRFWWFLVVCIPITLIAYTLYLWDYQTMRRCGRRFWMRCRGARKDASVGIGEKDPNHLV